MHARRSLDILYKHVWRRGSACHINLMAGQDLVKLERDKICENIDLIGLRVPAASCGPLMSNRVLKPFFYVRPRIKHVRADETDPAKKILLLNQSITSTELSGLPISVLEEIKKYNAEVCTYKLNLGYDDMSAEQVLRQFLPESVCVPSGFESIGHILHLNLREAHYPYRKLIGEVLLEKNKKIRSVVNKVGTISNEYRVFDMEVIAGDSDLKTEVKEHGIRFRFDFRQVYWNSRLQTEHQRIVNGIEPGSVVCDMFCGVGPFAVPAAKRGCVVYANDLNPNSYKHLLENTGLNKVGKLIHSYNKDARLFFSEMRSLQPGGTVPYFDHIIMNLPANALEFLDAFTDSFSNAEKLPTVHCHCFSSEEDHKSDIIDRAEAALRMPIADPHIHWVRQVAPNKNMYCLRFRMPSQSELVESEDNSCIEAPTSKRARIGQL